jgi:hypothetical protein
MSARIGFKSLDAAMPHTGQLFVLGVSEYNLGGRRCWQVIDYLVTSPARFLKVVTRSCRDLRDPNDSKMCFRI